MTETAADREVQDRFYSQVYDRLPKVDGARGWIQWKGTDVCVDLHCTCGSFGHFDGYDMYTVRCTDCGRRFLVAQDVALVEMTDEEAEGYPWRFKDFEDED